MNDQLNTGTNYTPVLNVFESSEAHNFTRQMVIDTGGTPQAVQLFDRAAAPILLPTPEEMARQANALTAAAAQPAANFSGWFTPADWETFTVIGTGIVVSGLALYGAYLLFSWYQKDNSNWASAPTIDELLDKLDGGPKANASDSKVELSSPLEFVLQPLSSCVTNTDLHCSVFLASDFNAFFMKIIAFAL